MRRVLPCLLLVAACNSSTSSSKPDAAPLDVPDATPVDPNGCTVHVQPGADPDTTTTTIEAALVAATAGSVICFDSGTYQFSSELDVTGSGITIKGVGDPVLDFSTQKTNESGIHGMNVMDFVIEDMIVHDAPNDAIRIDDGMHVTMRNLTVTWTDGPNSNNGAYALYPVTCNGVLIEGCDVSNSSDAAIYVGQSQDIVVRNNTVHSAAAGIEIENSTGAEVYGNWSFDNPSGILVFALPGLPITVTNQVLVHDNYVEANNLPTFASAGNVVAYVPSGTGMIIMAAGQVEVRNNTIESNDGTGIVVNSCNTLSTLSAAEVVPPNKPFTCDDPSGTFVLYPSSVDIHDNLFYQDGLNPPSPLSLFEPTGNPPLQDILWDGDMKSSTDMQSSYVCIMGNGDATYLNGDADDRFGASWAPSTDATMVTCSDPAVPTQDVSWTRP